MDHETYAEELETEVGEGKVFEAPDKADHEGENDSPEAGADTINVVDVTSVCDGEGVHYLEVRVEVGVPDTVCL